MRETPNLLLKLPDPTDYVLVEDLNENFTKLDTEIAKITDEETGVEAQLAKHLDDDASHITADERTTWNGKIDSSEKGQPGGVAALDNDGNIIGDGSWKKIADVTTTSVVGEVTFSVLDLENYSRFKITTTAAGNVSQNTYALGLVINNDLGLLYDTLNIFSDASTITTEKITSSNSVAIKNGIDYISRNVYVEINIDLSGSYIYVSALVNGAPGLTNIVTGRYRKNVDISSLTITPYSSGQYFATGSKFALWGIRK